VSESDDERPLAIVDLDGVVADVRHRLRHLERRPKNWAAFFAAARDDAVHPEGVAVVEMLGRDHEVVFLTGRPHHLYDDTVRWLDDHGLGQRVVMRPHGDHRPAAVVKLELLEELADGRTVGIVVDDDPLVLDALRRAGYHTFAADWEARPADADRAMQEAQEQDGRT
jgi:hypothetical protein